MNMATEERLFCQACRDAFGRATKVARRSAPKENERGTSTRKLLNSSRWRRQFRMSILRRDDYACQNHKRFGVVECGSNFPVDHIIPRDIAPDLTYSPENCETLCPTCHNAKTRREQDGFVINWRYTPYNFVFTGGTKPMRTRFVKLAATAAELTEAESVEECFRLARESKARPIVLR